jgi:CubicO group peptidase (beta-lactamase class C family)
MLRRSLLFVPFVLVAQSLPPDRVIAIEQAITATMSRESIPGVAVAIGRADRVVFERGYGLADLENFVPVKASTVFRLASISKPITAVAVMQLAEKGALQINEPIQKYVPNFPPKPHAVTAAQLMAHLGGIRHYRQDYSDFDSTKHYDNVADAIEIFANDPLVHEPGTKYLYTTYGYSLLGAAVQTASGQPYSEYVTERVLRPAGMLNTQPDNTWALILNRVRGYSKQSDGRLRNCNLADTSNKIPGGGWSATAGDMVRFAQAFQSGKLVSAATRDAMLARQKLKDGSTSSYGYGFFLDQVDGRPVYGHTGGQQGTSTVMIATRDGEWSVAALANLDSVQMRKLGDEILRLLAAQR